MTCDCLPPPPDFDIPPPPDPSLIWHLLSEEPFEKAPDCDWNPFISVPNVIDLPVPGRALVLTAIATVVLLVVLLSTLVYRILRGRRTTKSKASSSDAIMTCGDNVWTYNSMKSSQNGVQMYGGGSHHGSRIFAQTTPATLRSYAGGIREPIPIRHCASTTLRLHPQESLAAYHSVQPTEYYEEIPARGTLPPHFHIPPPPCSPPTAQIGRMSMRRPPPTQRPPPPPKEAAYSPTGSDGSIERELQRLPTDSPPCRWEEEGRESGYGTAPSRQWRTPPGSGSRPEDRRGPLQVLSQAAAQTMTYV